MTTLLTGSFLAAFALTLGADNEQAGLFTAMVLIGQPTQLVGLFVLQKVSYRKRIVMVLRRPWAIGIAPYCGGIASLDAAPFDVFVRLVLDLCVDHVRAGAGLEFFA
jgi:hypothetical protein